MARTKTFCETDVLDKAIGLFTAKGYNGTSAQDIVDTLGISRSSLYDTFGDKQGLFLKAVERYRTRELEALVKLLDDAPDFPTGLHRLFQLATQATIHNKCEGGCLLMNAACDMASLDTNIGNELQVGMQQMEEVLHTAIKKAKKSGEIHTEYKARELAAFYYSTLSGLRVMAKSGATQSAVDDVVKLALSLLS